MQIVIPMSGFGERFRRAGYGVPKPLIPIEGKPVIAHVIDLFPGEVDFLFICNQDHLDEPRYAMAETLARYCPTGRVVGIPPHKLGPIHAVRQVQHLIDPARPVVVNYCDFTCYWDWSHFKAFVARSRCAGAIPAYKGFHPHTLGTTNYAYMRETGGWVEDIQEKQPYTDNRMEEYASSGTYYFASGQIMAEAFAATMDQGLNVGGEYYVSLAYKPLLAEGAPVAVYPVQHFMQWGTPEDVAEYEGWSRAFRRLLAPVATPGEPAGSVVLPMAGLGQRFVREGYELTKPLIPVSGEPMVVQAMADLPTAEAAAFVLRADMPGHAEIAQTLTTRFPGSRIVTLPGVTEGQAITAQIGAAALADNPQATIPEPLTFGTCDHGMLYDPAALAACLAADDAEVVVWAVRGHPNARRHPQMYGWVDADESGRVRGISVKKPLTDPATDPIVLGTFTFRRLADFQAVVDRLVSRGGRVNGEFYLDSCVQDALELGLKVRLFEVDHYLSWGTPNDLRTFEYWQSCFHKWAGHPYKLIGDARIPPESVANLAHRYRQVVPSWLEPRAGQGLEPLL